MRLRTLAICLTIYLGALCWAGIYAAQSVAHLIP